MSYVYYCSVCGNIKTGEKDTKFSYCKKCGVTMWQTHLTTEEWEAKSKEDREKIKEKFDALDTEDGSGSNTIGNIIRIIAYIFIAISILGGIVIAGILNGYTGFIVAFAGCFSSLMLLGFAEIIKLLQEISNK